VADEPDRKGGAGDDSSQTAVIPKVQWPTVEPDQATTVLPTAEPDRTHTAPTAEPDRTKTVRPATEPDRTHTARPTTEPHRTHTARPTTEPDRTHTARPTTEPDRTHTARPTTEPETVTILATEPKTVTILPAAEAAETTTILPAVDPNLNGSAAPSTPDSAPRPKQQLPIMTWPWRRIGLVAAATLSALGVLYGVDLLLSSGELPRGVTVAGVSVGGMKPAEAEQKLHLEIEPRLNRPVAVRVGDVDATIDPTKAGLQLDWGATLDSAGSQPFNPWTRLTSLFSTREVGVVTTTDQEILGTQVDALRARTDREPAEGTIRFEGTTPVAVEPKPGQTIDRDKAVDILTADWVNGTTITLPVTVKPVNTTTADVREALESVAKPAMSGPVTMNGEGGKATLAPKVIATVLVFEPGPNGGLNPKVDNAKVVEALRPQLAKTEQPGKDASVVLEGARPVVKPSVDGRGIDWDKSLEGLLDVLRRTDDRTITATYAHQPAKFTTEQANQLGITEVVGEFTTSGFKPDSGVNIRAIAAKVNGALVKPGETFSLNGYTGPRGTAQGYVEAGIIESGRPGRAVGGGCSQFATTLFNAAYFAGMTDVEHREHSYYISRYPEAREATVFQSPGGGSVIDVKFRNDSPSGVLIQTIWTPTDITVRMWSTKRYTVESATGGRSEFTDPGLVTIPPGEPCSPVSGAQGFTVTNTRIVRDASSGQELKRNNRTAVYQPLPQVVCAPAPPPQPPAPPG
jgi:vancomycin resistance protein YoaR